MQKYLKKRPAFRAMLAGLALGVAAAPASGFTRFEGGGFVGSFAGCESQGWAGANPVTARLLPAGLPGNDPLLTTLVLQLGGGTHSYRLPADLMTGAWVDAEFWEIWSHAPHQVTDPQVRVRLILWASDAVDAGASNYGTFHGLIENFNGLAGCSVRVGVTLRRRD